MATTKKGMTREEWEARAKTVKMKPSRRRPRTKEEDALVAPLVRAAEIAADTDVSLNEALLVVETENEAKKKEEARVQEADKAEGVKVDNERTQADQRCMALLRTVRERSDVIANGETYLAAMKEYLLANPQTAQGKAPKGGKERSECIPSYADKAAYIVGCDGSLVYKHVEVAMRLPEAMKRQIQAGPLSSQISYVHFLAQKNNADIRESLLAKLESRGLRAFKTAVRELRQVRRKEATPKTVVLKVGHASFGHIELMEPRMLSGAIGSGWILRMGQHECGFRVCAVDGEVIKIEFHPTPPVAFSSPPVDEEPKTAAAELPTRPPDDLEESGCVS